MLDKLPFLIKMRLNHLTAYILIKIMPDKFAAYRIETKHEPIIGLTDTLYQLRICFGLICGKWKFRFCLLGRNSFAQN